MRKRTSPLPCLALILATAAFGPLRADEPVVTKDFKIRTGYGLVTKDKLRPSSLALGFNFSYGIPQGKVGLEVGYFYKTGDQYIEPIRTDVPADLTAVNLDKAGDSRRNTIEGLSVRLSFQQHIDEDWSWQAGLMIGGSKFKHEYVGDVQSLDWTAANTTSWRETYSGTPASSAMRVSPYAGFVYRVGDHSSIELNLLILNYQAINYVHHPGTSSAYALDLDPYSDTTVGRISAHNDCPLDSLEKSNRLIPTVEFGYMFHF